MVPQNPVWQFGNDRIKDIIESQASGVTGVKVQVGNVTLQVWNAKSDIRGFLINNPEGYKSTPYFMKCDKMYSDVSWLRLFMSFGQDLEIEQVNIKGLSVYIEQQFGLASNVNDILAHVFNHPFGRWAEDNIVENKRRKYIIDRIKVEGMKVHVLMTGMEVAEVEVPPLTVSGIGVKENGVVLEELIGLLVNALSVSALDAEDEKVKQGILKSMKDLKNETWIPKRASQRDGGKKIV